MSYVNEKRKQFFDNVEDVVRGLGRAIGSFGEFIIKMDVDHLTEAFQYLFRDVYAPIFKPIFEFLNIEDETIYQTAMTSIPLLDEEAAYLKNHIVHAVINDLDITEQVRLSLITSQRVTLNAYFKYGKNHYIHGIPTAVISEFSVDNLGTQAIIEIDESEPITIITSTSSEVNLYGWIKYFLFQNYSYNFLTKLLVVTGNNWRIRNYALNGTSTGYSINVYRSIVTQVDVEDHTVIETVSGTETTTTFTRTTTIVTNETPAEDTTTIVDTNIVITDQPGDGSNDGTTIVYVSGPSVSVVAEDITLGTEAPLYNSGEYYQVYYTLDSAPTLGKIWFYELASNTYPDLEPPTVGGNFDALEMLPIIPIRRQFSNINSDTNSAEYKSSTKLLDTLNMISLDELTDKLNQSADITQIQDAYLVMGVNLYSQDKSSLIYLMSFFGLMSKATNITKLDYDFMSLMDKSVTNFTFMVTEGRYNTAITAHYIEETIITGSIGSIGHIESEIILVPSTEAVFIVDNSDDPEHPDHPDHPDHEHDHPGHLDSPHSSGYPPNVEDGNHFGIVNNVFIIRVQETDTTYSEIRVEGLSLTTYILTEGTKVDIKVIELVDPTSTDASDLTDKANFIIPISNYLLDAPTPMGVEQVTYDAVHLVIYAEDSTDLAYYQTAGFFSLVDVVIRIGSFILLAISLGAAQGASSAALAFTRTLLIQYGYSLVLKELLTHNLSDAEKVALLALYAYVSYETASLGAEEDFALTFVDTLLLTVNTVSTFIEFDTAEKIEDLTEEQEAFESLVTSKQEEFDAANEYLNPEGTIDILNILNSKVVPILDTQSTPDQFYERGLTTNLADIVLDAASTYLDSALDLDYIKTNSDFT